MDAELRPRPRIDARTTAWLLAQRERVRELELERARLKGQLELSERVERASQRYMDRLEEKLDDGRRREASLARALGYAEAQRDQLATRLAAGRAPAALERGPIDVEAGMPDLEAFEPVRPARGR